MPKKITGKINNGKRRPITSDRKSIREDYTIKFEGPTGTPPQDPPKQSKKDD
ncbi:hypothetical protein KM799_02480 [Clostridium tyrobutyricum]|jgi:hypothetical protein|uniref:hypothetical protein n=1 Tax=Clostridium tyrobutyricum TaxID=1519 RepID=UPI001C3817D9|nr:hypothetical protein [Clostridium tyrobutyricum]MBV4440117.1 hypothetical protein [Clostridium tyrobutyricum]MBV4445323.1 hypothetical protein [Clostridium tyrobutyricum]MBV4445472.1 hypothetical protein [Clostridium tyrobutyricum]